MAKYIEEENITDAVRIRQVMDEVNQDCAPGKCGCKTKCDEELPGSYENIGRGIGRLVDEKNRAYSNSFRKTAAMLMILYPDGIKPRQYEDAALLIRLGDKMSRIAGGDKQAFGENPFQDIAGYGMLGSVDR